MGSYLTLPLSGMQDPMLELVGGTRTEVVVDRLKHLILPGIAMGLASAGSTARYMRSALLETIRQDYIRTARAKGLRERTVIIKHAMRNAMLPVITLIGLSVPYLFSGAVLIETVFAWPGMGRLILSAIYSQDTPLMIACFFVFTVLTVSGNLMADLAYALVDPRIKYD
jgi:peptide/nickel transport system permease protein